MSETNQNTNSKVIVGAGIDFERLEREQQVRSKPSIMFGTNDIDGAAHGVYEIIANAIDEAREGRGSEIDFTIEDDNTVEVVDRGSGISMAWNKKQNCYNWELAFCTLYSSGKYGSSVYKGALGTNGCGLAAMQFASEFMHAESTMEDGNTYIMDFRKGKPVSELKVIPANRDTTGTLLRFKPDPEVFVGLDEKLPTSYFVSLLNDQAMLIPGLKINCNFGGRTFEIYKPDGAAGVIKEVINKNLVCTPIHFEGSAIGHDEEDKVNTDDYKVDMKVDLAFTKDQDTSFIRLYHNGGNLFEASKNKTYSAMRTALTNVFNGYMQLNNKLGKNDSVTFKDIEPNLVFIGETNAPGYRTYFVGQTKGAITNSFIAKSLTETIQNNMIYWLENNKKEADKICEFILTNKKIREESEKVSKNIIKKMEKGVTVGNRPDSLFECLSKNPEEREIYLCEGKSAGGSLIFSRDKYTQALLMLRGKIKNAQKNNVTSMIASQVIREIFWVLGCGIETNHRFAENLPKFDFMKLRYRKIMICTDADVDGAHIVTLILALFYNLAPSLIKSGCVYVVETPLFTITYGGKSRYAYTNAERDQILDELRQNGWTDNKIKIERSKGLGENSKEMLEECAMNPATRRIIPVTYSEEDKESTAMVFESLMGGDIDGRREIIEAYFKITAEVE